MPSKRLGANYWRLWTASGFSNLADGVFQIALPLLALELTRSPVAVAGVTLAGRLPWLLFALPAGALADRLDRRRTMVNVDAARVVVIGGLAVLTATDNASLAVLYVAAFVLGVGETLFDTAAQSVMPAVVGPEHLSTANGRLYAVELTTNQFIGPPIGGLVAGIAVAAAFAGSAGLYLLAAIVTLAMAGSFRPRRDGPPTRIRTDIAEGLRYLWRHRLLRTLALMVGVMNFGNTAAFAVIPLFAVAPGELELSEAGFGLLLTTLAVGGLLGSAVAAPIERRLGRARTLMLSVVASSVPALTLVLTSSPLAVGAGFVVLGMAAVVWNVITVSLRQRIVPDHMLGRINAGYRLLAWGTQPIGAAVGGVLGELAGLRAVFLFYVVSTLLLVLCRRIVTDEAIVAAEVATAPAS